MKIEQMQLKDLIPYERNAKKHDEKQIKNVMESIKEFGFSQPLVVDKNNCVIIGHCRLIAAKRLKLKTVPIYRMENLTEDQVEKLRLLDNKLNESEWDFDLLLEDIPRLDFSNFDIDWQLPDEQDVQNIIPGKSLTEQFVVPPFSILDTRQGYWQDRKKEWKDIGIKSELGRKDNLTYAPDLPKYANNGTLGVAVQTSIFDPVLAEIMYKWFCTAGGQIFDCFAGGSVRGVVASKLGYKYLGIDLRQEQVDANIKNAEEIGGIDAKWVCDDSLNADKYIPDNSADMIFTCPPYADLEIYSDDKRDISNMKFEDFLKVYREILHIACKKLKDNRFAVIVIGDVRDKKGIYRDLIDYTKAYMKECGMGTYNEFILVEAIGTGAFRAKHQFVGMRKAIKTHQNVLCFYKGNPKCIKDNFEEIDLSGVNIEE